MKSCVKNIKFCPACGHDTLRQNNEKSWHCQNCDFIYFHNVASAVVALLVYKDEVLLTVRKHNPSQGMLDLPGGFADYGETFEQALTREIQEELDLDIRDWSYHFSYANEYEFQNILYHTTDAFFIKELPSKPTVVANDDVADALWLKISDIDLTQIGFMSIRHAIRHLQQNIRQTTSTH